MMMKLMKVLVVALVAGGVFAPVASQAGEVDGKAIMCKYTEYLPGQPYSDSSKAQGLHLRAYQFSSDSAYVSSIRSKDRPRRYATKHYGSN